MYETVISSLEWLETKILKSSKLVCYAFTYLFTHDLFFIIYRGRPEKDAVKDACESL